MSELDVRAKVLLVDDEPNVLASLRTCLRREGHEILTAPSGAEALLLLRRCPVDVVVADQDMPGIRGTELLSAICEGYPNTIRIMLTGHARLDVVMSAINEGEVYRFLTKPVAAQVLAATIRDALMLERLRDDGAEALHAARNRAKAMESLERESPGITDLSMAENGALELTEPDEDIETLLAEMERMTSK